MRQPIFRKATVLLVPAFALPLAGCQHDSNKGKPKLPESSAARIQYALPSSSVTLTATMELRNCAPPLVIATIALAAKTGAGSETHAFDPQAMPSALKSRDFKIELTDKRILKSINATSSDETGTVIANVIKMVGSFVGLGLAFNPLGGARPASTRQARFAQIEENKKLKEPEPNRCNTATVALLAEVESLEKRIADLRLDLVNPKTSAKDAGLIDAQIAKHAERIADIRTSDLTVTMTRTLSASAPVEKDMGKQPSVVVPKLYWTVGELSSWFSVDPTTKPCDLIKDADKYLKVLLQPGESTATCSTAVEKFGIEQLTTTFPEFDFTPAKTNLQVASAVEKNCTAPTGDETRYFCGDVPVTLKKVAGVVTSVEPSLMDADYRKLCGGAAPDAACDQVLVFRDPLTATVAARFIPEKSESGQPLPGPVPKDPTATAAKVTIAVPQFGKQRLLKFDTDFAEKFTTGMTFDEYGRPVTLNWSSTARAVAATSAITSAVDNATAIVKAVRSDEAADQKAEMDRLNNLLTLNKLRWCQAVIEAGGNCDLTKMPATAPQP